MSLVQRNLHLLVDRPLRFQGDKVAEASRQRHEGPAANRWIAMRFFDPAAGKQIAQRGGKTIWMAGADCARCSRP